MSPSPHDESDTWSYDEYDEMTDRSTNEDRRASKRTSHSSKKRSASMAPLGRQRTHADPEYPGIGTSSSTVHARHVNPPERKAMGSPEGPSITSLSENKSDNPGILGGFLRKVGYGTGSYKGDFDKEHMKHIIKKLEKLEMEVKRRDEQLEANRKKMNSMEQRHRQEMDAAFRERESKEQMMRRAWEQERAQLKTQNDDIVLQMQRESSEVTKLRQSIAKNEAVVTKAHATLVSSLAGNVSRSFTDDMVKDDLKRFFQGDFFSWCADMCSSKIHEPETSKQTLEKTGILNSSQFYKSCLPYLQFHMDMPDGSSPFVLLQAALAAYLCRVFLRDAHFLAEKIPEIPEDDPFMYRRQLVEFEHFLSETAGKEAAIDWRIQTVESLEKAVPLSLDVFVENVSAFTHNYDFLLGDMDDESCNDLLQIIFDFATLSLKLWKTRTSIQACHLQAFANNPFDLNYPYIEADAVAISTLGQSLNGRPMGVLTRPLIISEPVPQQGQPPQTIVWMKAVAWVSSEQEPKEN